MRNGILQQVVANLPEEAEGDIDVLIEKLYLLRKIEESERQLARGEGLSQEEVERRLKPWLESRLERQPV